MRVSSKWMEKFGFIEIDQQTPIRSAVLQIPFLYRSFSDVVFCKQRTTGVSESSAQIPFVMFFGVNHR